MPISTNYMGKRVADILVLLMDSIDASSSTFTYNSATSAVYLLKFRNTGFGYLTFQGIDDDQITLHITVNGVP